MTLRIFMQAIVFNCVCFGCVCFGLALVMSNRSAFALTLPCEDIVTGIVIIHTPSDTPVAFNKFIQDVAQADFVLIGERHGVAAHPLFARCVLFFLSEQRPVKLVLEMISNQQQDITDTYRARHPDRVEGLGAVLQWWTTGWPDWRIYQPLFEAAWITRTAIVAGDFENKSNPSVPYKTSLPQAVFEQSVSSWTKVMEDAHCGLISSEKARELGILQVTRDSFMAQKLKAPFQPETGNNSYNMLYAGRAHVRKDRAVPAHLRTMGILGQKAISIGLYTTSEADHEAVQSNMKQHLRGIYDYVVFIGNFSETATCKRLESLGLTQPVPSEK